MGSVCQRCERDIVGIRKRRFLTTDCAHAYALVDAERPRFDNALFQTPAFGAGVLEIQVCFIDFVRFDSRERVDQVGLVQAKRLEQKAAGNV